MGTPRWPNRSRPYTDAQLRDLLARLPATPFHYRALVDAVAAESIADGRGLVEFVANSVRASLFTKGLLRTIATDGASLLQKVDP